MMLRAADEIYCGPEGTPLSTQLIKFQRNKKKVRISRREYGDIGEKRSPWKIFSKDRWRLHHIDNAPTLAESHAAKRRFGRIDSTANVREINKAFNWHLPEDDARTQSTGVVGGAGGNSGCWHARAR